MTQQTASLDESVTMPAWAALALRREVWGGLTLIVIWLAVLFVGIFGGNVQTADAGGGGSSFPVVVVVALIALFATISVGRWAFPLPRPASAEER